MLAVRSSPSVNGRDHIDEEVSHFHVWWAFSKEGQTTTSSTDYCPRFSMTYYESMILSETNEEADFAS